MLLDAAEALMAELDPLTVSLEQVAAAAGTSRPLLHAYFGDRRGLLDAVQVRVVRRLDEWVEHGLKRSRTPREALLAMVTATFSFVDQETDSWRVLMASGGLDHPDLHAVRTRWSDALADADPSPSLGAQAAVGALLSGAGGWVARGEEPGAVAAVLGRLLRPEPAP
ncbi:MAG: TetR family transcriptional regulator [Acidimicrobiales bacterium]|nr:TetR family transcriptional regulator [Acidimicrobiales bacterium]